MGRALKDNNLPVDIIQIVPTTDKEDVIKLMQLRQYVDVPVSYTHLDVYKRQVYRHLKKLDGISQKKSVLLLPRTRKPYSEHLYGIPLPCYQIKGDEKLQNIPFDDLQVTVVDVPFGVIPLELDQVYPLAQNESPASFDENSLQMVNNVVQKYLKDFKTAFISADAVSYTHLDVYKRQELA